MFKQNGFVQGKWDEITRGIVLIQEWARGLVGQSVDSETVLGRTSWVRGPPYKQHFYHQFTLRAVLDYSFIPYISFLQRP